MAVSAAQGNNAFVTGEQRNDPVNHPAHYTYGGIETMDYIDSLGMGVAFCLGNVIKYVSRAGHKDSTAVTEDLRKAQWYLNRAISKIERGGLDIDC